MQQAAAGSAGAGPAPSGWTDPDLANASYDSVSFSVAAQSTLPVGLCFSPSGENAYVSDFMGTIFQYTLSTAFDISTASYANKSFVSGLGSNIRGCFISEDGSSFYIADQGEFDTVAQFSLSTNFDISSAATPASATFSVNAQEDTLCDVFLKPDGTKMYIVGTAADTVFQYSLSTAFNISTASYDGINLNVSTKEANPRGIFLSPDGTYLLVGGSSSDSVHGYSLNSAWDVSSASFVGSFSMASQETDLNAIWVSSDGSKVFGLGLVTDTIYQYSTA
jgi:sugar lactone lactonase YvrE